MITITPLMNRARRQEKCAHLSKKVEGKCTYRRDAPDERRGEDDELAGSPVQVDGDLYLQRLCDADETPVPARTARESRDVATSAATFAILPARKQCLRSQEKRRQPEEKWGKSRSRARTWNFCGNSLKKNFRSRKKNEKSRDSGPGLRTFAIKVATFGVPVVTFHLPVATFTFQSELSAF